MCCSVSRFVRLVCAPACIRDVSRQRFVHFFPGRSSLAGPFCFIGKRRLQKALAQVDQSKVDVRVHWKAFQLNPAAPAPGVNKIEMYKKKFGPEMVQRMLPQMVANGKRDGINFSFGGNSGNTLNSHRLVAFADKFGKQDAMNEAVFRAYFENVRFFFFLSNLSYVIFRAMNVNDHGAFSVGSRFRFSLHPSLCSLVLWLQQEQDISDDKVLIKLAKDVGLDEKTVSDFLAGSELKKEVSEGSRLPGFVCPCAWIYAAHLLLLLRAATFVPCPGSRRRSRPRWSMPSKWASRACPTLSLTTSSPSRARRRQRLLCKRSRSSRCCNVLRHTQRADEARERVGRWLRF